MKSMVKTETLYEKKVLDNIKNDLYTNGFLGNVVTHYEKLERMNKNKEDPLCVQKLSKHARKRARAVEESEGSEIIPRRYQKPFYMRTDSEVEDGMCRLECDSDEQ